MDNQVHFLINNNGNDIPKVIENLNISYAYYFSRVLVYKRVGHLFQDRFKSETIDDDSYFFTVSTYIHNTPVKAGIVKLPQKYKCIKLRIFPGKKSNTDELVDTERIKGKVTL